MTDPAARRSSAEWLDGFFPILVIWAVASVVGGLIAAALRGWL